MKPFKLIDHLDEVKAIAAKNNIGGEAAAIAFVANLSTMKEHNEGSGTFNYHTMGQAWNKLKYTEKNEQRDALMKTARGITATGARATGRREAAANE